ncbi:MAG: 4-hydroxy-tetrahydrodipicolinate reductase [Lachnospiraceae bacterium]|nr:4-hydroxy-tetrahydrodipicolinate reductase [Lachnospiraceae bacterium]MBR6366714.1 4-hydroxy-tetrahydrodipicolinate reductase [Lachnospiraceae bacterium]
MVRVILHGCNGKMGRVLDGIISKEEPNMEVVAGVDPYDGITNPYPVFPSIKDCTVDADVIIDFASAKAVDDLLDYALAKKVPVVLCTTGLTPEQIARVGEASKSVAILRSANMSLGINLLLQLVKKAAVVLSDSGFDIEIVERHHNQKLDAPSGTALALADSINDALDQSLEYVFDRSQVRKKREKKELGISAVRGGSIVGEHEIVFAGLDEVIEFKHTAYSKSIFAKGAVSAAKYLFDKGPGLYDMQQVIAAQTEE